MAAGNSVCGTDRVVTKASVFGAHIARSFRLTDQPATCWDSSAGHNFPKASQPKLIRHPDIVQRVKCRVRLFISMPWITKHVPTVTQFSFQLLQRDGLNLRLRFNA
jgi:hypothetical protein